MKDNIEHILIPMDEDGETDFKNWTGVAGMCDVVIHVLYKGKGLITTEETSLTLKYIKDNKPDNTDNAVFCYWWDNDQEGVDKRVSWIDEHITIN